MILNDPKPRRASRAWILPFAGLALGLFATPVTATGQEPERREARIEIRVNGEPVEGLSRAQRRALLDVLRDQEPQKQRRTERRRAPARDLDLPKAAQLRPLIQQGLAEARRELEADEDLRELGITDDVVGLLDDLAAGKGIDDSFDGLVKAAMKGAGKMAMKEIEQDEDLKRMGLTKGIGKLVQGFLESDRNQELIADFARNALDSALKDAKREIREDDDLRELGLTEDVTRLIDTVVEGNGGDGFDREIEALIEKAAGAAMERVEVELDRASDRPTRSRSRGKAKPAKKAKKVKRGAAIDLERELDQAREELERARQELRELQRRRRDRDEMQA